MASERVLLGELIQRVRRPIEVDPQALYTQIGTRSYGKGCFTKDPVTGEALGNKKIFTIKEGDLVFNIVFAWEGSVALAGAAEDSLCGSHRFPTYRAIDDRKVLLRWLFEMFRTPAGVELLGAASPGSAGRNRTLNQDRLLQFEIDLPPLEEQERVVSVLTAAELQREAADVYVDAARQARRGLGRVLLNDAEAAEEKTLGELADISIGRTPPRSEPRYWTDDLTRRFCTITDMAARHVLPIREGVTEAAEQEKKAKRVPAGALLMSFKLTIGKVGFAATDLFPNEAIAWISPHDESGLDLRYLATWLNLYDYTTLTGEAVKGKTLNTASLRSIPVKVPPLPAQQQIADLLERADEVIEEAIVVALRADEVLVDLRRELFSGVIGSQIPEDESSLAA
jgi:restriction endonuclease S subunit